MCGVDLSVLHISDTVKNIALTESAGKAFKKNSVLVIGSFDTYAELFAKENKLRFLHRDIELARVGEYSSREGIDIITLDLFKSGKARIKQANYCPGSSAGNNGGRDMNFYLPIYFDFWNSRKEIILLLRKNNLLPRMYEYIYRNAEKIFIAIRTENTAKEYAESLSYLPAYNIGGMHSMLIKWIESGMAVPSAILKAQLKAGFQSPEL